MATTPDHDGTHRAAPIRPVNFMPRDLERQVAADGTIRLRSRIALADDRPHLPAHLRHFARTRPASVWLAQRSSADGRWRQLTYGEAAAYVDRLTEGLLARPELAGRPLAILSGNSLEHALVTLAAMQARMPVAAISPAYAGAGAGYAKFRHMLDVVDPAAVFVQTIARFAPALAAWGRKTLLLHADEPAPASLSLGELAQQPTSAVEASVASIDPDAVARLMFTSGSTGLPKAVIHTQRTIVEPVASQKQALGASDDHPIRRLDWTPWNHIFGATSLALATATGGTIYIDDGRPVQPLFAETVRNLRDIQPTSYGSVPAGFAALVAALEDDPALARRFFAELGYVSYAAARLPDDVGDRLEALAVGATGYQIAITTGYGSTETTSAGAFVHWPTTRTGMIGLPQAGIEMKLVPFDETRFEIRVRGIGVTPGYLGQPEATAAAFDDEGYYMTGDTAEFLDRDRPEEGLVFTGRIAEEFKLQTGIFVKVGSLRAALIDRCAPLLQEVVICGENEAHVAAMGWLDLPAARRLAGLPDADRATLNQDPAVRADLARALAAHNRAHRGSSESVRRLMLLDSGPSLATGEVTDKGSINQALARRQRAQVVSSLFAPSGTAAIEPFPHDVT